MEILKNPNFDFLGKARYFIGASLAVILAGLLFIWTQGIRSGVEFSGGTQLIVKFERAPEIDKIRDAVSHDAPGAVIQTYDAVSKNQVLIRIAGTVQGDIDTAAQRIVDSLSKAYPGNRVLEHSSEVVGPIVGAELRRKAVQLTVLGLVFQLVYIAVRFKGAVWGAA